jgi:mRNA interferase YafQ
MTQILYTPSFLRQFKKLPPELQEDIENAIKRFQKSPGDTVLKLHKLKGKLKGFFSFSVNYNHRIVCEEDQKGIWALLSVGDHAIYR